MPRENEKKTRLPFDIGFIGGIVIVLVAREVAAALEASWLLYVGVVAGGWLCVRAVFKHIKDLHK